MPIQRNCTKTDFAKMPDVWNLPHLKEKAETLIQIPVIWYVKVVT